MTDDRLILADAENIDLWTILGDDTEKLTTVKPLHLWGKQALSFDKCDGGDDTICAGVYRTISADLRSYDPEDQIFWTVYIPDVTDVVYAFVRLGTDASNYVEYRYPVGSITDKVWTLCTANLNTTGVSTAATDAIGAIVGTGADTTALKYLAIGVAFSDEADALTDILVGDVWLEKVRQVV